MRLCISLSKPRALRKRCTLLPGRTRPTGPSPASSSSWRHRTSAKTIARHLSQLTQPATTCILATGLEHRLQSEAIVLRTFHTCCEPQDGYPRPELKSCTASLTTNVDDHGQDIGHSLATSCRWALHCDAGLVEATDEERD